uniref:Tetratricopeptide repeat protein n=1 Tax=Desulfobacca acetoxidans TaxID=60893 RepID=A0A7C5ALU7_9BACT
MKQPGWHIWLLVGAFLAALSACETYSFYSARSRAAATPGPETPAAQPEPPPEPQPATPDPSSQMKVLEERLQQLERRLAELEQRQATTPAPGKAASGKRPDKGRAELPSSQPPAVTPAAPSTVAGDRLYNEGLRLYQSKKFPAARTKFSQYLKEQPRGPKAAEARYYLGDSFYQEKKYAEAKEEFNKLVLQHPQSILAPAALLRQAYAYQQLNQKANYQAALKKLVQKYPQSPEGREAQKLLKQAEPSR